MRSYIERAFQRLRGYGDCVLNITVPCDWKMPEESEEGND